MFTEIQILDIVTQLIAGIAYCHMTWIIHRDIKPENIFITEDNVVILLDFGAARRILSSFTGETVVGTLPY